ncbi:hypothetical protein JCM19236_1050 [Vibrio sp. JCM 19236]|nr:hypothetical protein JCM19236_1050 [Vibrio sp. JCM 19236]
MIDLFNLDRPINESGLMPLLTDHKLSTMDTGIYASIHTENRRYW